MKLSEIPYEYVVPGTRVQSEVTGTLGVVSEKQCTWWDREGSPDPDKMFVRIDWDNGHISMQPHILLVRVHVLNT